MEEIIDRILSNEENNNIDFVVHINSKNELNNLINVLEKKNFIIEFNLFNEKLREWMLRVAKEDKFDTCFRIRNREDNKCVAYNPSIEHWRLYCKDIIEFKNGEMVFNEGKYTKQTAEIEADKIIDDIKMGSYLKNIYGDKTKEQIVEELINHK